jgi:thymidylate kinase
LLERLLIVLTGPVGGGKSTVASALAERFREIGHPAAVIDLDVVYCMARQSDGFDNEDIWSAARRGTAALADVFFDNGMSVVVVEGGFFTLSELDGLRNHVTSGSCLRFVTLDVSSKETLRRAQSDPSSDRTVSRSVEVQQRLYAQFAQARPFLQANSLMIDANILSPIDLAQSIVHSILLDESRPLDRSK